MDPTTAGPRPAAAEDRVPDFRGLTTDRVLAWTRRRRRIEVVWRRVRTDPAAPRDGRVVEQSPAPGAVIEAGEPLELGLATPGLVDLLPTAFQAGATADGSPAAGLLTVMEESLLAERRAIEETVAAATRPVTSTELDQALRRLGWEALIGASAAVRRRVLARVGRLRATRGTADGVAELIRAMAGESVEVRIDLVDASARLGAARLGELRPGGPGPTVVVHLQDPRGWTTNDLRALARVLGRELPAGLRLKLRVRRPSREAPRAATEIVRLEMPGALIPEPSAAEEPGAESDTGGVHSPRERDESEE